MNLSRRDTLKYAALTAGGAILGSPFAPGTLQAADDLAGKPGPKRFVFFLISNGFHPAHVRPKDMSDTAKTDKLIDVELAPHKLPEWSAPLEPYKDRMTILHGVNGEHCDTSHGSPFGCLAGVKKGKSPKAETIDHAIARLLPKTPLPMLGIGLGDLQSMRNIPISYSCSAAGNARPLPLFSDPRMAFQNIFGCVADGKSQEGYLAETAWYDRAIENSDHLRKRLSGDESVKFDTYINGLRQTKMQRMDLMSNKESLAKYKPEITDAFENPKHSGDWWEASIDVGVAALRAGVTNVLTVDCGLSSPDNMPMDTLNLLYKADVGKKISDSHDLGHRGQMQEPLWRTARHYSWTLLERIIKPLATTPEPNGKGMMLDNTLIVYTSDSGEIQHSFGVHWPFLLIGNLGGRIRSGRYIQFPTYSSSLNSPSSGHIAPPAHKKRPNDGRTVNALWATLLHAAGKKVDDFNLDAAPPGIDRAGPLEELLA